MRGFFLLVFLMLMSLNGELYPQETEQTTVFAPVWSMRPQRVFELGIGKIDMGVSNSVMSALDMIRTTISYISFQKEFEFPFMEGKGFFADAQLFIEPVSVAYRTKQGTLFEFKTAIESRVYINLGDNTIKTIQLLQYASINPGAINDMSSLYGELEFAAYAFFEMKTGISKTILDNRLLVQVLPALYIPLVYAKRSTITLKGYDSTESANGFMGIKGTGEISIYAPFHFSSADPLMTLGALGADFSVNALFKALPVLDAGAAITHIPLVPAILKYRSSMNMNIDINIPDTTSPYWKEPGHTLTANSNEIILDFDWNIEDSFKIIYYLIRPVRFSLFVHYKPFGNYALILTPTAGVSFNTVLADWAFNYGLALSFHRPEIFSFRVGSSYFEYMYTHYIEAVLDFFYFEIDGGITFRSHKLSDSFMPEGLGIVIALKFGY